MELAAKNRRLRNSWNPTRGCALGNRRDEEMWLALATGTRAAAIEFDVLVQALVGDRLVGGGPPLKESGSQVHTKAEWARVRSVSICSAGDRNRHNETARIDHLPPTGAKVGV